MALSPPEKAVFIDLLKNYEITDHAPPYKDGLFCIPGNKKSTINDDEGDSETVPQTEVAVEWHFAKTDRDTCIHEGEEKISGTQKTHNNSAEI